MLVFASDHRGYKLKQELVNYFRNENIECVDVGTDSEESTDFPIYAKLGAKKVLEDTHNIGVFICHSGNGMVMAGNRFKGIRASLCTEKHWAMLARRDDLANVIVIPSGIVNTEDAKELIKEFLNTPYGDGKYKRRADMIDDPNY